MVKRRAKDVFESAEKTKEHAYVIFPGEEMVDVTLNGSNSDREAKFDFDKIRSLYEARKRTYVKAHEHPMKSEEHTAYLTVPSITDFNGFLLDDYERMMVVAQRNSDTGKIEGYFCVRKTKKTDKIGYTPIYKDTIDRSNPELRENVRKIGVATKKYEQYVKQNRIKEGIDALSQEFHLKYRFVPASGYKLDGRLTNFYDPKEREEKERKIKEEFNRGLRKQKGLDTFLKFDPYKKYLLLPGIIILIISLIFLSSNITGYSILNSNSKEDNFIGIFLFIISIGILVFSLKKFKK